MRLAKLVSIPFLVASIVLHIGAALVFSKSGSDEAKRVLNELIAPEIVNTTKSYWFEGTNSAANQLLQEKAIQLINDSIKKMIAEEHWSMYEELSLQKIERESVSDGDTEGQIVVNLNYPNDVVLFAYFEASTASYPFMLYAVSYVLASIVAIATARLVVMLNDALPLDHIENDPQGVIKQSIISKVVQVTGLGKEAVEAVLNDLSIDWLRYFEDNLSQDPDFVSEQIRLGDIRSSSFEWFNALVSHGHPKNDSLKESLVRDKAELFRFRQLVKDGFNSTEALHLCSIDLDHDKYCWIKHYYNRGSRYLPEVVDAVLGSRPVEIVADTKVIKIFGAELELNPQQFALISLISDFVRSGHQFISIPAPRERPNVCFDNLFHLYYLRLPNARNIDRVKSWDLDQLKDLINQFHHKLRSELRLSEMGELSMFDMFTLRVEEDQGSCRLAWALTPEDVVITPTGSRTPVFQTPEAKRLVKELV